MNYRINLTKDEVVQYLDKKDYDGLYQRDQFRYVSKLPNIAGAELIMPLYLQSGTRERQSIG